MDGHDYCRDKAAPEGSSGYYATLLFPSPAREGLVALRALELELAEVVEDCSERAVAEHKLAYWRQELAALLAGSPSHPVTRDLSRHAGGALTAELVRGLLDGVHARITRPQVRDDEELDRLCRQTAGALGRAAAALLSAHDPAAAAATERAAAAAERVRLLRLPRRAGLPPHSGVPLTHLSASGATPRDVDTGRTTPAVTALRRHLVTTAGRTLRAAVAALPSRRGYAATRAAIAQAELRALERSRYAEHGHARPPLPLTLLWHAWRHRP